MTSLGKASKGKLEHLNQIHEVIYGESSQEGTQVSTLRTLSEDMTTQHGIVFDFTLKPRLLTAITRQQTRTSTKRVKFAETPDEDSEAPPTESEPDQLNDAATEPSYGKMVQIPLG
ncbi:unnamed protein product [Phytophthora fragariaefolia]|uniref:Unnamed protein product n=1 Tax=Phytophthora fragariaefolia TaxID=1490495 RepID=A0A9W7D1E2_9STRA|nr:unnamed protein product [Phytophthora fragariaefolia]